MDPNSNWNFSNIFQNPNFQSNSNSQNPNENPNFQTNPFSQISPQNFPNPQNPQIHPQNFWNPQNPQTFPYPQIFPYTQYSMYGQIPPYHPYPPPFSSQPNVEMQNTLGRNNSQSTTCSESTPNVDGLDSTPVVDGLDTINLNLPDERDDVEEIPAKSRSRPRWTHEEDHLLVSCWLNTSKDSIIGTDQSYESFWNMVSTKFNSHIASIGGTPRTRDQCKDHWNKNIKLVTYFDGCHKRACDLNRSGWSDQDYMENAKSLYKQEKGKDFSLMHWWEKVKDEQKWTNTYTSNNSEKRTKVSLSGAYTSSSNRDESEGSVRSRPIGRNAAKKKGKAKVVEKNEADDELLIYESKRMEFMEALISSKEKSRSVKKQNAEAMEKLAKSNEAKAKAVEAKAQALKETKEMEIQAAKEARALEILSKPTSHMSEEDRRNHEQLCKLLMKKYFPN